MKLWRQSVDHRRLSVAEAAQCCGVSRQWMHRYMNGQVDDVMLSTAYEVSRALGVDIRDAFEGQFEGDKDADDAEVLGRGVPQEDGGEQFHVEVLRD